MESDKHHTEKINLAGYGKQLTQIIWKIFHNEVEEVTLDLAEIKSGDLQQHDVNQLITICCSLAVDGKSGKFTLVNVCPSVSEDLEQLKAETNCRIIERACPTQE